MTADAESLVNQAQRAAILFDSNHHNHRESNDRPLRHNSTHNRDAHTHQVSTPPLVENRIGFCYVFFHASATTALSLRKLLVVPVF